MILQQHKIVFAGTMGAGKSEAIKSLSSIEVLATEAINTDTEANSKMFTTVGIDYGEIILDDETKVGLYGTPGQDRFDFMWTIICKGAIGIIILIDHSRTERLQDLEFYLDNFKEYSDNIVIGITHLDEQNDQMLKIYRDYMIENNYRYPLFGVDVRLKNDVLLMIEALIAVVEVQNILFKGGV